MRTVLLVDDDRKSAAMYAMGLIAAGYAVTTAGSARAALEAITGEMAQAAERLRNLVDKLD